MAQEIVVVSVRADRLLEERGWSYEWTRASLLSEDGQSDGRGEVFVCGSALEAMVEMAPEEEAEIRFRVRLKANQNEEHREETPWRLGHADQIIGVIIPEKSFRDEFPEAWTQLGMLLNKGLQAATLSPEERRQIQRAVLDAGLDFSTDYQAAQEKYNKLEAQPLHAKRQAWLESVAKLIKAMTPGGEMDEETVRAAVNAVIGNGHDDKSVDPSAVTPVAAAASTS